MIDNFLFKFGIRFAVSEGINDVCLVPLLTVRISLLTDSGNCALIGIGTRLVIAVADVNALFVIDEVVRLVFSVHRITVAVNQTVVAEVIPGGRHLPIARIGIRRSSGRIHRAV